MRNRVMSRIIRSPSQKAARRFPVTVTGGLCVWALVAVLYIARSPGGAFAHDFPGHRQYTQILALEHRLPHPREGVECYQPPLYYLLNVLLLPRAAGHIFIVRVVSVLYGVLTLGLVAGILRRLEVPDETQFLALGLLATTPAFLFLFTTYNNDALATLISVAMLAVAYELFAHWKPRNLILLGALAGIGVYVKLTALVLLAVLMIVLAFLSLTHRWPFRRFWKVGGVLLAAACLLIPWLIGHNLRLTGRLFPSPPDYEPFAPLRLPAGPLRTLLTPPGWTAGEWADPFTHMWDATGNKNSSYVAYLFLTSIFGEQTLGFFPRAIARALACLHGFLWISASVLAWRSAKGRLAWTLVVLGFGLWGLILFHTPLACMMDFRYVAWVWLPAAALYSVILSGPGAPDRRQGWPSAMAAAMMSGIVLQSFILLILIANGRWRWPY